MNWTIQKWKDVLSIVNGKNQRDVVSDDGAYPIIGSGGEIGRASKFLCEAGATVVGRKGTINNPFFVEERFWNVDTAFGIQPGEKLNPKFLFYFCKCFNFKNLDKSTTIPSLAKTDLLNIEMPVPSLKEQRRIVNKIEELFSELDSAVETLKKTKEQLAVYRQSVLKDAFDENFETALFGEIMQSRLGKMLDAAKNIGKPQKYLRNINVRWLGFDLADLQEMKIEDSECEKYSLKNGDLIMCEGGEPGRCAVWDKGDGMFFQKALHRIRFNGKENPKFYMYYFLLLAQSDGLKKYFTGSGIKHLTGQSLVKIVVPVAPLKKQNEVIKKIESQFSVCENIEKTVNDALMQADAMRQSILKKAFEGGL